jgi:glycosyltransferase involved in cell wall biosynthesis
MIFHSDRYGFNNPDDSLWDNKSIDILIVGDSAAQGVAMQDGEDIAGRIREKTNSSVINLGNSGNGPLLEELKEKHTLANVSFFNKTPQNQVVAFLKDCDFLYDGYLKSEVYKFGNSRNKYVEYCLAAKPMLVSYEGFDFFIEQYKCGVVVKPESVNDLVKGVEWLMQKDNQVLKEMGENAFNFATDNLQISNQVNKLLSALNNV